MIVTQVYNSHLMKALDPRARAELISFADNVVDGRHRFRETVRLYQGEDDCG